MGTMIRWSWKERSLTKSLSSERKERRILVKIRPWLPPRKRRPRLKPRRKPRPRLPRARCQRRRKNLLNHRLQPPMPPLKLMRDFLQNLPQLLPKENAHGTSESEMDLSCKIQSSVISFQTE